MPQVSSTITIHAPADAIWQVISDFGAASKYLTGVVGCTVEGEGAGAVRRLTNADGSTIVERLIVMDVIAHRLSYALLTDSPFHHCLTTIALHDQGNSHTELRWSSTFQPDGLTVSEAVDLLESALEANCLGLKQYLER